MRQGPSPAAPTAAAPLLRARVTPAAARAPAMARAPAASLASPAVLALTAFLALTAAALLAAPAPLAAQDRPIIMIDAGHGGDDPGVVEGELLEKDLVLRIAFAVASEFVRAGHDVRFTRTGDYAVAWNDRRAQAEEVGAALLLMLHINRNDDATRHGAEVYFSEELPASRRAAAAFGEAFAAEGIEVLVDPRPFPFLQSPEVPTVMLEIGFLTNPVERRLLVSESYHHELGRLFVRAAEALLTPTR